MDCFQPLFMLVGNSHVLIVGKQIPLLGDIEVLCLNFIVFLFLSLSSFLFYGIVGLLVSFSIRTLSEVVLILLCFSVHKFDSRVPCCCLTFALIFLFIVRKYQSSFKHTLTAIMF